MADLDAAALAPLRSSRVMFSGISTNKPDKESEEASTLYQSLSDDASVNVFESSFPDSKGGTMVKTRMLLLIQSEIVHVSIHPLWFPPEN